MTSFMSCKTWNSTVKLKLFPQCSHWKHCSLDEFPWHTMWGLTISYQSSLLIDTENRPRYFPSYESVFRSGKKLFWIAKALPEIFVVVACLFVHLGTDLKEVVIIRRSHQSEVFNSKKIQKMDFRALLGLLSFFSMQPQWINILYLIPTICLFID